MNDLFRSDFPCQLIDLECEYAANSEPSTFSLIDGKEAYNAIKKSAVISTVF